MNMIPFGRLYVPLEFQHYNRFYTNRSACCISLIALFTIFSVIYYEMIEVGNIISKHDQWQAFQDYYQLLSKYNEVIDLTVEGYKVHDEITLQLQYHLYIHQDLNGMPFWESHNFCDMYNSGDRHTIISYKFTLYYFHGD